MSKLMAQLTDEIEMSAAEGAPVNSLVQYDAARKALQAAHSVDEVRDIKDKAEAVRAYARQAGDTEMQNWAVEIKLRAERRAGELLAEMKKAGILATLGDIEKQRERCVDKGTSVKTLDELEIRRHDAAKWQRLANVPEDEFELAIRRVKNSTDGLTGAALHRALNITTPTNEEVLQMFGEEWWEESWQGMPEFDQRNLMKGTQKIVVHFKNQAHVQAFAKLIGQKLTEKTRSIWYPPAPIGRYSNKKYIDVPNAGTKEGNNVGASGAIDSRNSQRSKLDGRRKSH